MGENLNKLIEKFCFTAEGRESFLKNLEGLSYKALEQNEKFPFHPEYFWPEDLSSWPDKDRDRLLGWLYREAWEAALNSTENYDYYSAPADIDELEKEVVMMQFCEAIWRVLQLRERYRFTLITTDPYGRPIRRYADGRTEYISNRKKVEK